jgi:hypothetical protein
MEQISKTHSLYELRDARKFFKNQHSISRNKLNYPVLQNDRMFGTLSSTGWIFCNLFAAICTEATSGSEWKWRESLHRHFLVSSLLYLPDKVQCLK